MATQSAIPSTTPYEQSKKPGPELLKSAADVGAAANESSEKPIFSMPEPMREEQVQNAVKFLSHPQVRGSPVIHRRSFLEKKGLTKEEIDEAFRRVLDPPPDVTTPEASTTNQATQAKSSTSIQPLASIQTTQLAPVPVTGASMLPSSQTSRFHWSHAFLALGVLATTGAGTAVLLKNTVVPRLKAWILKVVEEKDEEENKSRPSLAAEAAEAAKMAAEAALLVAKASQDLLNSRHEDRKYFEAFMRVMDVQVKELKFMGQAVRKLESTRGDSYSQDKLIENLSRSTTENWSTNNSSRINQLNQSDACFSPISPKQAKVAGLLNTDFGAVRPSVAPASMEPLTATRSKSYVEGPWEIPQKTPSYGLQSQLSGEGKSSKVQDNIPSSEPWRMKKTVMITDVAPPGEEQKQFPVQRGWVPTQPPSVVMPEAAAAIRQPKPSFQNPSPDDRLIRVPSENDGEEGVARGSDFTSVEAKKRGGGPVLGMDQTDI